MLGFKKAKRRAEELNARNKYNVMQTHYNKQIFDRDREKIDRQREKVVHTVKEYKKNAIKKRDEQENYLSFLVDTRDDIMNVLEECEADVKKSLEEDVRQEHIKDAISTEKFLRDIEPDLSDTQFRNLKNIYENIKHFLIDLSIKPKRFQVGAAMALYLSLGATKASNLHLPKSEHKAALLTMPPASGKSYVIALLCAMVCEGKQDSIDNVVIAFPNEILYQKDRKLYESMQ